MSWDDRLDDWDVELELAARFQGSDWVTLEDAALRTGVSRAVLRTWYRGGQIPWRLTDGPHGPQRLVPLAMVTTRAQAPHGCVATPNGNAPPTPNSRCSAAASTTPKPA